MDFSCASLGKHKSKSLFPLLVTLLQKKAAIPGAILVQYLTHTQAWSRLQIEGPV